MFNYKKQFERCNRPFIAITQGTEERYEDGKLIPGTDFKEEEMQGIILQINDDDLRFDEGGTLTYQDRKILIDTDHYTLSHGQFIYIDGEKYQVHDIASYERYSHFEKAIVKRVTTDDRLQ